ncbi:aminopeptidase N-like [Topomyia yanbarensis]|uniref:aminopeptidase N-like n=1 Tax=Topomyia yanbarensis TaxID=2498891 RepID=UPI00273C85FF|nr:aminopeptidase N-like [Topomyia yanbarensis]
MKATIFRFCLMVISGFVLTEALSPLPEGSSYALKVAPKDTSREIDQSYFLPRNTVPSHYFIQLFTDVHKNDRTFQATTEIYFDVLEPTSTVTMHLQDLDIQSTELFKINGLAAPLLIDNPKFTIDTRIEHVVFLSKAELSIGKYILKVTYSGAMLNYQSGYLISTYRNNANEVNYVGSTHFQATLARRVFPCYDEPDLKTTFTLWITYDKNYNAVSNMLIASIYPAADESYLVTKFRTTPKMSTYLLAFAVTNFVARSDGRHQILVRPNAIDDSALALEAGTKILDTLDKYTGLPYYDYMPKMTQIAIPDRGTGAMENWGLVAYGEPALLFNPAVNSYRSRKRVTTVIAHEFTHQWFGNLVSPRKWEYIWLNEGFATLYEYYATDMVLEYRELFNVEVVQRALGLDASENIRPMNHPAASQDEIWHLFDIIAYQKSGSVLNMFRQVLGDENWQLGLHIYLNNRKLSSATPDDLYDGLQAAIDGKGVIPYTSTVKQLMESWTNAAGYPLLNIRRMYNTGEIIISQERFLADKHLPGDHIWSIPYNYIDRSSPKADEKSRIQWLTSKASKLSTNTPSNQWIIFNREQFGYYRVNYDQHNWELIIDALFVNPLSISRANRAQLVDDSFNLARSDRLDMGVALKLLTYLRYETDYAPWAAANNVLNYFYDKLRGTAHYPNFVKFVEEITAVVYKTLQIDTVSDEESTLHKYLKQIISNWACRVGNQDCLDKAYAALRTEVDGGTVVHPDVAAVIYCHGLRTGTYKELSYLLPKMVDSRNQAQRTDLIAALGCSKDENSVKALLTAIQLPNVVYLSSERSQIVNAIVAGGREGIDTTINFLMTGNNARQLLSVLGEGTFNEIISGIALRTNSATERQMLEQLLMTLQEVITAETAENARAVAKANADWFNSLEGLITIEFFEKYENNV